MSEQGHHNDLMSYQQQVDAPTVPDSAEISTTTSLSTDKQRVSSPIIVSSDSDHCNMMTQLTVSFGFNCHTIDNFWEKDDVESSSATNLKSPHPSWIHVFLKTSSTSSLGTQCAAAAYLDVSLH